MPLVTWLALIGFAIAPAARTQAPAPIPRDRADVGALIEQAYDAAFNLDHDRARELARRAVALAPDQPRPHRALATVLWTNILFRTGAVTVDHFMGSLTKSRDTRPPIPPGLEREFNQALSRAIALSESRVEANRDSSEARYELGAAYAIQASFRASIEGSVTAAFGSARRAYQAQEAVLARDPNHPGANVIAGTYRYVVSDLGFAKRWMAYLAGFDGDKELGIGMIESAARHPGSEVDGLAALLLIYSREERWEDALRAAEQLAKAYPQNRLFVLEAGAAALRAGHSARAEEVLTGGLQALADDPRPKAPGERAVWFYKRAAARIDLGRTDEAGRDLDAAFAAEPLVWIRGRLHFERGRALDLAGRRTVAIANYRQARRIAADNNDPIGRRAAERFIDRPYRRDEATRHVNLESGIWSLRASRIWNLRASANLKAGI